MFSDVLDLITSVGETMNEQELSNLSASRYASFAIDKDDKVHGFSNQTLLRCAGRFRDERLKPNKTVKCIISVHSGHATLMARIPGLQESVCFRASNFTHHDASWF